MGAVPRGASASPPAGWEHRLPLLPSHTRPGVPSPSASLTGLPDEAFESLTQLQHIYVAHNRVSPPPLTQGLAFQGSSQAWVTWPSMGQHGIGGWNGTT